MSIIIDTNVLSEIIGHAPDSRVDGWIAEQEEAQLFLTTITEAELLFGLAIMPHGRRRDILASAIRRMLFADFTERILPFDRQAAQVYADIKANRRSAGRTTQELDCQIAAIAYSRGMSVATRNVSDFQHCGIEVINPWDHSPVR